MGETFGHAVPGVFYCVIALILLFLTKQNRGEPSAALTGTRGMRAGFGWGCSITAGAGIVIEGTGGILHSGEFFFQFAHEVMYLAFFTVGLIALLESRGRMPSDSWRFAIGIAFFVEGLVFYGHMLEQKGTEQMLHFIMVMLSWFTAASYILACVYKTSFLPHVLGGAGMLCKGLWFFIIANILYSGTYGHDGENLMIADGYTVAGVLIIFVFSIVGVCVFGRGVGQFDDDAGEVIDAGLVEKYNKVAVATDA